MKKQYRLAMKQTNEFISVSEMAEKTGKTKQAIYSRVKRGVYETRTFRRGSMIGVLIKEKDGEG